MLTGKTVVLGVTGGIACYKSCEIVSRLKKLGADVHVIMTESATNLVSPLTFETLSKNRVAVLTFDDKREFDVEHIALAKLADIFVVAPATANSIAKFALGIADDMLSTTLLATKAKKLIVPAMNTEMYIDEATQTNLKILEERGFVILDPVSGMLACGDEGKGKMAEPVDIVAKIVGILMPEQDFAGRTVLVTAGATKETIDGVRYLSNESSGKMGVELAKAVKARGGKVVLVAGSMSISIPSYFDKVVRVTSTEDMYNAVMENFSESTDFIMAGAPADYRPKNIAGNKIKDFKFTLELEKTPDIAKAVGEKKENKKLVIFSAETENLTENATKKLKSKNADLAVANDVTADGAGFGCDTNIVTIITKDGKLNPFPKITKDQVANIILDYLKKV